MAGFHRWSGRNSVRSVCFSLVIEKLYLEPFGKHDLARANSTKVAYKNLRLPKKQYQKYQIWVGM